MAVIKLTQDNFKTTLADSPSGSFFLIEDNILLYGNVVFPEGCVVEFRGGKLSNAVLLGKIYTVDLNGANVVAPAYCIFGVNLNVKGFANSSIMSEWFRYNNCAEHTAINRALTAAAGCPVILEKRTYNLTGSIKFPKLSDNARQTLVSPGSLVCVGDIAAIMIDVPNVTLDINFIDNDSKSNGFLHYKGSGIRICGDCYGLDIVVYRIYTNKGIVISPDVSSGKEKICHLSNSRIKFQVIYAVDCIYVESGNGSARFTDTAITGGRMMGQNGIYFSDLSTDAAGSFPSSGLTFFNVGLEDLKGLPIRLRGVTASRLLDLRMSEALPIGADDKWIDLKDVTDVEISVKSSVSANRIQISGVVDRTVVRCYVPNEGYLYKGYYDMYVIMPMYNADGSYTPQAVATSSVQPYNICKTITADKSGGMECTVKDLFPEGESIEWDDEGAIISRIKYFVLPRTLIADVKRGCSLTINLNGLGRIPQCVLDIYVMIESGGRITFKTSEFPSELVSLDGTAVLNNNTVTYGASGLYRLTWGLDRKMVITKLEI